MQLLKHRSAVLRALKTVQQFAHRRESASPHVIGVAFHQPGNTLQLCVLDGGEVAQRSFAEHREDPVEPHFARVVPMCDRVVDQVACPDRDPVFQVAHADFEFLMR